MGHFLRKRQVHTHKTERNAVNIHKKLTKGHMMVFNYCDKHSIVGTLHKTVLTLSCYSFQ